MQALLATQRIPVTSRPSNKALPQGPRLDVDQLTFINSSSGAQTTGAQYFHWMHL